MNGLISCDTFLTNLKYISDLSEYVAVIKQDNDDKRQLHSQVATPNGNVICDLTIMYANAAVVLRIHKASWPQFHFQSKHP